MDTVEYLVPMSLEMSYAITAALAIAGDKETLKKFHEVFDKTEWDYWYKKGWEESENQAREL